MNAATTRSASRSGTASSTFRGADVQRPAVKCSALRLPVSKPTLVDVPVSNHGARVGIQGQLGYLEGLVCGSLFAPLFPSLPCCRCGT
jgi:hypothetical protein